MIAFSFYGVDKAKAKFHLWRIPEKILFLLAFLGGGIGAIIGMQFFHHKTKHFYFYIINFLTIILWAAAFYLIKNPDIISKYM